MSCRPLVSFVASITLGAWGGLLLFLRKHLMVCSKSTKCQNTINCSLNHYTVKCCDLDLWETTTWLVVSLSQLFHICFLYKSWARSLTKYGHVLYSGTMLSHLHCLDAFQALLFRHNATEEMLQLWARFVTRLPVKDKVIYWHFVLNLLLIDTLWYISAYVLSS